MRESDWAALADIQFILYNRIANQLNEALTGIALSDMPEASGQPPGFWKDRAVDKITNVLNMFTAWTWLIRYKSGEPIPQRAIRPFETNALLTWIGRQLQLSPPPTTNMNPLLQGNQETLQEALLLLHSVAYTQGSNVRLAFDATRLGTWFRIRFNRSHPMPGDLDEMLASFSDHWRDQDTVFELTTARDFIRLNGCTLTLSQIEGGAEFAFFVREARVRQTVTPQTTKAPPQTATTDTPALQESIAIPATPQPGQTKQLDPDAVARYLDQRAPTDEGDEDTPVSSARGKDSLDRQSSDTETGAAPPTLAMLRPVSPAMRARISQQVEQSTPPGSSTADPQAEKTEKTESGTIILRARIPEPQLPKRFHKPPAATSNVALTRDTQTFVPVKPDDAAARDVESRESRDDAAQPDWQEALDQLPAKEDTH